MLNNKKILLCVTGGIAVYKAAALTSKLVQAGAQVKVIMSESAAKFVAPLTFQALSRNDVYTDTFEEKIPGAIAHIDLADWPDLIICAPATANTISKLAAGIADNMVTTTMLASTAPVWIAPAMNVHMYNHPAIKRNIETLYEFGYRFIEPAEGYLACGYVGKGRLEEPEKIAELADRFFQGGKGDLKGKTILVTAGPTRERIDPVRFISNDSSGKMGYAIAEEAVKKGANVILVSGPVTIQPPNGAMVIDVESAEEMYHAILSNFDKADIVIKSAAVSDYRPKTSYEYKVKKKPGDETIELERTKDILKELGTLKTHQVLIGFAAETNNLEEYARKKLLEKNVDLIVANNVKTKGAGFGSETNIVTLFRRDGSGESLPIMSKHEVAKRILREAFILAEEAGK
ncbi:bifunctional phosphopantothenoylcysteine decarboxylase/phosphopantothenate--cysteine ligase CoaBC [Neobacillus notoginsengisoli]|uniref:Coenzyme A biosynthesis bifunctional protein CoaBC n=1 Tax=Neobacillus notoginsengisoli TaxID=1578198 RepID=A0A417YR34_9BACI|nr:bifunctional phosphopantothenoylcysteine decarboxylase/phosphopantothenate--cysteine ligase CoaBC [Neobacillus notoginsengisoli]RHW36463.1 bifunctional phosphopantothenoylcysteine decarboxylase/phosphopantothenate--cysteine ligase CoaBC [Neobacillus notoginsengisoli]